MAFAALKRLGQSLLGNDTLRKVQQHLERDEGALAWREACSESWSSAEGLATSAVAAGCCGHWDEAAEILQRVESLPAVSVEEHLACQALLHRVCALREQQQTGQGLLCGPLWCPEPPALELPASWSSWARALPQVAEYVGPVEVRWTEGSERGLFTSRAVEAGEVLMVAQPIAFAAQNGPLLVAELRRKCAVSQRARRRLECLADGGARGSTVSPEEVTQELFIRADEPPGEPTVEASPEGDLRLQDILNHNVFVVDHSGEAALYGLPSMLNHSCDVTALKLVLVFFEKAMIFIATRDLEKGEELCHRYFDVEGSVRERRGESSKWGFSCDCCRCHFEANTLPFSDCGKAVEAAVTLFQEELRYDMRALSQAAEVKEHLLKHKKAKEMDKGTKELIKAAMKQDRVCAILEDAEVDAILTTMEYFQFSKGSVIVEQGKMGTTFFVTHSGTLEVSVNGNVVNTLMEGQAFGGLALLYNCPRTATVKALIDAGVWGANGHNFKQVLAQNAANRQADNLKFLDSIKVFDGLNQKQKDQIALAAFSESFDAGQRVATQGEALAAIYFVKKGGLAVMAGGEVKADGKFSGGKEEHHLSSGEYIGAALLLSAKTRPLWENTLLADAKSAKTEVLCISVKDLKEILGNNLAKILETALVNKGLRMCPVMSQFSSTQRNDIAKAIVIKDLAAGGTVEEGVRYIVVLEGAVTGMYKEEEVTLERAQWLEDGGLLESDSSSKAKSEIRSFKAGANGARVGFLTKEGLLSALKELGLAAIGNAEEASDLTRKLIVAKKVHIFRHLSSEQITKLVQSFVLQRYRQGAHVIKQGEVGSSFFVIASGDVKVEINGKFIRTMTKNSYFGERALLFDEPRTATVEVSSPEAELWSIEKSTFSSIVKGKMQQELMHRIRLQDTDFTMKDLKTVRVIGAGAAGVVRLVMNKKTGMRYALKRVRKSQGKIPVEVKRECELLKAQEHPFIMRLVQTFETTKSVYILTELITGGELHGAIREIPTVLSRTQAQFYTGCLIIVLEELSEKNIVYRDLKPENVMLDAQGYLKLIDFGIAKKLDEGKTRTFTMIGTPHYMAPEIMRGHGYGTEVDLWSLGIILFEFVCGYLPFADELDDPTEVCTAVLKDPLEFHSRFKDDKCKSVIQGMLNRQPKKRLGAGMNGWEDIRNCEFFLIGHQGSTLFDKIMGRELEAPVMPKGEKYCEPTDVDFTLSDEAELG